MFLKNDSSEGSCLHDVVLMAEYDIDFFFRSQDMIDLLDEAVFTWYEPVTVDAYEAIAVLVLPGETNRAVRVH